MVSVEKLQRGISRYIEVEVLPHLSGKDKWIVAGAATMYLSKLPAIIQTAAQKSAIKVLGVITEDGMVDAEYIISSIKPAAHSSPATFTLPLSTSTITLRETDLDVLLRYITEE